MNEEWRNEQVTKGAAADAARDVYKRNTTAAISAMMAIKGLPSAQPQLDEWCDDCKEYDHATHSCPRFNHVIRTTLDDVRKEAYKHGKSKGIKKGMAMAQRMKGRWIHDGCDIPHGVDWMHCSVCGRREPYVPAAMTNYCSGCGADMMETE